MAIFRRIPPSWPTRVRAGLLIGCALSLATVQAQAWDALAVADPARPVTAPALVLPPSTPLEAAALPTDVAAARALWQRANQRVAEFPRGHADLLRWEADQAAAPAPVTTGSEAPLDFAQALRLSLRQRPELFTHADMNALARRQVGSAYAAHVRELRHAWVQAVAAGQSERVLGEVLEAARTGSELGRRMVAAGNWSQARLMREQLIEANAWQASAQARADTLAAQERLAQLLGLWDAQAVAALGARLPAELPAPPAAPDRPVDAEATALRSHPTLAQDRLLAERTTEASAPVRRQAWSKAVDAALQAQQAPLDTGLDARPPHIGDLALLRDASLQRAVATEAALRQQASARRSQARLASSALQLRHASALHAQAVLAQLHTALEQETQLRYNGMLQSTWDLLASARERLASLNTALAARRDYWLARADWQALE